MVTRGCVGLIRVRLDLVLTSWAERNTALATGKCQWMTSMVTFLIFNVFGLFMYPINRDLHDFNPLGRAIFKNMYLLLNKSGRCKWAKISKSNLERKNNEIAQIKCNKSQVRKENNKTKALKESCYAQKGNFVSLFCK